MGGVFLLIASAVVACKKENISQVADNVTTKSYTIDTIAGLEKIGGILKFRTIQDYVDFVEDTLDTKWTRLDQFTTSSGFQNYFTSHGIPDYFQDTLSMDYDLGKMLNTDGVIILGEYAVKVDVINQQVYVSPETNLVNHYADLITGNISNKAVKSFSTADDVIEMLMNGVSFKCSESGVGSRDSPASQSGGLNNPPVNSLLRHSKFGIYFTLVIESTSSWPLSQFKYEFSSNTNERRYKRRCKNMEYVQQYWWSLPSVPTAKFKFKESVRNFSKYHLKARCHYYHNDLFMTNTTLVSTSDWMQIKINL